MNVPASEDLSEALEELRKYLSDALPPLLVVDSIQRLMTIDPDSLIKEIVSWAETQCSFRGSVKLSDFLYHCIRKIHMIGEYQLISETEMAAYLNQVAPHLLASCPPESRSALQTSIQRLAKIESGGRSIDKPAEVVYRLSSEQIGKPGTGMESSESKQPLSAGSLPGIQEGPNGSVPPGEVPWDTLAGLPSVETSRFATQPLSGSFAQFTALLSEIKAQSGTTDSSNKSAPRSGLLSKQQEEITLQLLAAAAQTASTAHQLEEHMRQVRALGVDTNAMQAMQQLAAGIPNYAVINNPNLGPAGAIDSSSSIGYSNSRLQAIQKLVELAGSPGETSKRFKEMVHMAVDQFNQGALARAVAILDSARELIAGGKTEKSTVETVRKRGHEKVDFERLISCAGESTQKTLLHRFLSFFSSLAPSGLLRQIKEEEERERRLDLLSLMEVHGEEARQEILAELDRILNEGVEDLRDPQFFQRNLLYLLNRVPCSSEKLIEREMEILTQYAKSHLTKEVIRELIRNLSKYKDAKAENALILIMNQLQDSIGQLTRDKAPRLEIDDLTSLLDRLITALAGYESKRAHQVVLDYCLPEKSGTRRNFAPLCALGEQNLSADGETTARLVKALAQEMPSKIFGFLQKKDKAFFLALIQALARTPTGDVRNLLQTIVLRDPDGEPGKIAAKILQELEVQKGKPPVATPTEETPVLAGELRSFDLPTILQYLETASSTGIVALSDSKGTVCAKLNIEKGRMKGCWAGRLKGADAVYCLIEKPLSGRFVLSHPTPKDMEELTSEGQPMPLTWILMEGVRRYDEYQQACLMIPDYAKLQTKMQEPPAVEDEPDEQLLKTVWGKVLSGLSPVAIENEVTTDPYRIRRCLMDWYSKGALGVIRAA